VDYSIFLLDADKARPVNLFSKPRTKIPKEGLLPRCAHSVYWPTGDKIAYCCGLCNPLGKRPWGAPDEVILPRSCGDDLNTAERLYANKKQEGVCPACASRVHYDEGKTWVCSECRESFKAPRKRHAPDTELAAA